MNWEYSKNGKWFEIAIENGKKYRVATEQVDTDMKSLDISEFEAIEMWLEDNDILVNEEQAELDAKAKANKSNKVVSARGVVSEKKTPRERTKKENPTKAMVIETLKTALQGLDTVVDINVENAEKIITFKIGDNDFKIDLTQKRKPKTK